MCWLVQWEHTTPPDSNQYPCWLTQNMSERGREEVETLRWDGRYRDRMDGGGQWDSFIMEHHQKSMASLAYVHTDHRQTIHS